ncbi:MAG: ABC transporter substrate-binding protein [Thermodesulfobacteriota bacterium]|nr:ABC transporter substrate-binding protein [Thermodesulfobacteriota bacterium]
MKKNIILIVLWGLLFSFFPSVPSWALTTVKVGALRLSSTAPIFIGMDKGFFEAEGIKVEPVWFKAAAPIAVAMASGDIDVGATGLTAALYNSIAQGMKITVVADKGREWPGYKLTAIIVNTEQWKAGVRDLKDLKEKRVGITSIGSTFHYILGNLLEKRGMSLSDVKVVPLGSVASMRDTVITRQIESAFLVQPHVTAVEKDGKANVLLWAGDHLPYQIATNFYGEKFTKNRSAAVAFMKGYIRSCRYYYDFALMKKEGPQYQEVINLISKYTEEKPEAVVLALPYMDRNGELYAEDIQKQLDWYERNGMVSKKMSSSEIVDLSFWKEAMGQLGK